jgi:hypothetical protein
MSVILFLIVYAGGVWAVNAGPNTFDPAFKLNACR